jgi:Na+-transporting NADH:ubiquinone oxidoreductase subunit NqrE
MNLALKITSYLSIILALFLIYTLIDESQVNISVSDISFLPLLIFIVVVSNAVFALLLLIGKKKPQREFLLLQIFIIIPTSLLLYQILFNSTVSCT